MALIPPDAAIRLRMQTETSLSPVAPLKDIAADLPDLQAGQRFVARIQQSLPENTYRALVNGKEIVLSLPETVKAGATVELVVVERSSRMVLAQLANSLANSSASTADDAQANAPGAAQLSAAGKLIGKLLTPAGQEPEPALLNRGAPLVTPGTVTNGDLAAALAPKLAQAATQSGMFYESHQALWLSGQRSTEALMEEPQARQGVAQKLNAAEALPPAGASSRASDIVPSEKAASPATINTSLATAEAEKGTGTKDLLQAIPAELRPLVQQQLDAATTQRVSWHGEVWPGQTMQWQIGREAPEQSPANAEANDQWNTSLALTTPKLGRIEAQLGIAGNVVRISLTADSGTGVSRLSARLPALRSALEAAGLKPAGLQVKAEVKNGNA